jgi:hypothetical protein
MRQADPPVSYLVGTPKGWLGKLKQALFGLLAGGSGRSGGQAPAAGPRSLRVGKEPLGRLLDIVIDPKEAASSYQLNRGKLRQVRRREGLYLLRTNLSGKEAIAGALNSRGIQTPRGRKWEAMSVRNVLAKA